uniref:Rho GTPase-activating protein SYDE2 n=1 Tax=Pyxicephalus adspersus TaxID=30357 RepID=A0AAV2ZTW9_PYXAD|nr:TPA: hypothetical protein GDO54_016201 [Pyxicephalus adspersus]
MVTPEESRLADNHNKEWSSQNHNNNNYSHPSKWETTSGPASSNQAILACRYSQYSNISNTDLVANGMERECNTKLHPPSCGVDGKHAIMGRYSYGGCHIQPETTIKPPNSAPYSMTPCFQDHWPHQKAPTPSYPLNFIYPPKSNQAKEPQIGVPYFETTQWCSSTFEGSRSFSTNCHVPPLGLVNAPYYGNTRNHSEDSEEDDYYDNDQLLITSPSETQCNSLFSGPPTPLMHSAVTSPMANYGHQERKGRIDMYLETDRLRSQLQEAYYLLIHAMHDMPLETTTTKVGCRTETCPSSSQSQDSVYSQSSARVIESDVWSSDEASPKQVSHSDLVSLNALLSSQLNRMQTFSKSVDAFCSLAAFRPLHKCHSDSQIKYSPVHSNLSSDCGFEHSQSSIGHHTDADSEGSPQDMISSVNWKASESGTHDPSDYVHQTPGNSVSVTVTNGRHSADMSAESRSTSQKPSGLTVKKMQKWMYKGRLLSLEMKERIIGSSQKASGSSKRESSPTGSCKSEHLQDSSATSLKMPGEMERPPMTGPSAPSSQKVSSSAPAEFSPPCSPNPSKKGGSINWSLPDKIKSPRTVRKLSMKMKKLPELSRKLSVKGMSSHSNSDQSTSKGNCRDVSHTPTLSSAGPSAAAASRNVISRYHLDTSVSSQQSYKKKSSGTSKSSSKGGYLSDGDSPELITKSSKHGGENRSTKGKESLPCNNTKSDFDIDSFRHYSFSDQPKCFQYVSGLMSLHFYGAEDLKPPRVDSKDVFCAIQVDSVNKARTALLTCRTSFLDMDHTFNIELENAQHLKLVVFSWDSTPKRNRVCCHGSVVLPALFRVTKSHQLAVKLEPRGLIYVKLTLMEQWENSSDRLGVDRDPVVFGVDARQVVEKENTGSMVPLLMEKCIMEIEKRGCQVVGLYRLCGSAAVKKELREAFERDSKAVELCENEYPDINVITGVLKDYLRELPCPLITKQLYEAVLHAMAEKPLKMSGNGCENDLRDSEHTVELLSCLPDVERATLKMLLDHLKLVASYHEVNKMTCQNLAVCFGPVLLSQRQETSNHNNRVFIDSEELASALDFKKHIEVLHYLLQLWPVKSESPKDPTPNQVQAEPQPCLRRKKPRPQMLNLNSADACRETDYADVPSESPQPPDTCVRTVESSQQTTAKETSVDSAVRVSVGGMCEEQDVNLQDLQESIDTLIGNLEKELSKNRLNVAF